MTDKKQIHADGRAGSFDKKPLPDKIGSSLRQLYNDVLNEDVPDDFLKLLKQADDHSRRGPD